jgi:acetyl esterase/lipase
MTLINKGHNPLVKKIGTNKMATWVMKVLRGFFIAMVLNTGAICALSAQQSPIIKDTSFTIYSAYQHIKKDYPEAKIARVDLHKQVKAIMNVTYCTINGRPLLLDVFSPVKSKGKLPAVLMIFGGGWRSGDRSMHIPMAKAIAANGYVVVTADYRLSTDALYPAAVNDLKTAVKWMRAKAENYGINSNKIAVWGFSAGGQLAALLGTTNNSSLFKGDSCYAHVSDAVQAILDIDGVLAFIHPDSGEGNESKGPNAASYWFGGSQSATIALRQQTSALNHVSAQTPPTLFINSAVTRMHAGRDDMIKVLNAYGIYSEVHTIANTPHTFILFDPWFNQALNYTTAFLDHIFKSN